MTATRKIEIELPEDVADEVARKVETGVFDSASAVVLDALAAAKQENAFLTRWLHEEVAPTAEAVARGEEPTYALKDGFAIIRERVRTFRQG